MSITDNTRTELAQIAHRYPQGRSGLLPMLHLLQSVEGYVSTEGIQACSEILDITTAEVAAVATFYTMYHRRPVGEYHIGVCINPGCAILGGDAVYDAVRQRLGIGHDEVTEDGRFSLERIECQAACTHAPVVTANWEFLDDMTPQSTVAVIDELASGRTVRSTRGPVIRTFKENERTLAGFDDGLADEGVHSDDKMLVGLRRAQQIGVDPRVTPKAQG
jgi:NADH-quinone oxidoreductase subunit E